MAVVLAPEDEKLSSRPPEENLEATVVAWHGYPSYENEMAGRYS